MAFRDVMTVYRDIETAGALADECERDPWEEGISGERRNYPVGIKVAIPGANPVAFRLAFGIYAVRHPMRTAALFGLLY